MLINPWIHDFAAYDLWAKPLGLLHIAAHLRNRGYRVHLIDCLDVHHPAMQSSPGATPPRRDAYGTGKFWKHPVPSPSALSHIQRPYSRYGLTVDALEQELRKAPRPSAVLVTSLMTYWYPGVRETIQVVKRHHPDVPVLLGGLYARLCYEHALRTSGADRILMDRHPEKIPDALSSLGVPRPKPPSNPVHHPYPAFDLLTQTDYVCLQSSTGCPYRCQYCASSFLNPDRSRRLAKDVLEEILYWNREFGVRDFAFYDDALLARPDDRLMRLLRGLSRLNAALRFHTPNGVHAKEISADMAKLLFRSGFQTIRLGLEHSDFPSRGGLDRKLAEGEFEAAANNLLKAGYRSDQVGAYILIGLPGQPIASVLKTIELVEAVGVSPYLAEYSPIPHTSLWENARAHSRYDIASEPLFQNNTLIPCWSESKCAQVPALKARASRIRRRLKESFAQPHF